MSAPQPTVYVMRAPTAEHAQAVRIRTLLEELLAPQNLERLQKWMRFGHHTELNNVLAAAREAATSTENQRIWKITADPGDFYPEATDFATAGEIYYSRDDAWKAARALADRQPSAHVVQEVELDIASGEFRPYRWPGTKETD